MILNLKYFFRSIYTLTIVGLFVSNLIFSQAGMYSESEIEFQTMFIQATLEKQKGNIDEQISILKEIVKRDKSADAGYFELAKAYLLKKDFEQAEKYAKKAVALNSSNEWYNLILAETYENSLQPLKAVDAYSKLIGINPRNEAFYHHMAMNQLKMGHIEDAVSTLVNLQDKNGISEQTSRRIFDIYNKSGKKEKALQSLETLSNSYPENTRYLLNLADYQNKLGKTDQALSNYKKVLSFDPDNGIASIQISKIDVGNSDSKGIAALVPLFDNKNIELDDKIRAFMPYLSNISKEDESIKTYNTLSQKLVLDYPDDAKAFAVRGDVLFYTGDFKNSEIAYDKAIKLDDRKYALWDQWMINLWELEKYNKLEEVSINAIDLFPNQVDGFLFQALAQAKNQNKTESIEFLDEATLMAGKNSKYINAIKTIKNWVNKESMEKQSLLTELSSIDDSMFTNPILFECLGDIYKHISNSKKSKTYWEKAISYGANEKRLNKKMGA